MSVDIHTRIALATALLNYKANPLQNINVVMEDYPLRLAVLHNDYEMVSLFVRYIDKNRENINLLAELHSQLKDQIKNTAVGVLNEFLNAL